MRRSYLAGAAAGLTLLALGGSSAPYQKTHAQDQRPQQASQVSQLTQPIEAQQPEYDIVIENEMFTAQIRYHRDIINDQNRDLITNLIQCDLLSNYVATKSPPATQQQIASAKIQATKQAIKLYADYADEILDRRYEQQKEIMEGIEEDRREISEQIDELMQKIEVLDITNSESQ